MTDLVSVIIPAYNSEQWIAETLESVSSQTYSNLEVIVVDDGSSDGTAEIVENHHDPRVRLVKQSNAGACAARNRALAEASGGFIQFLDADDLLSPDKIERQVVLLKDSPPGCLAVCSTVYFDDGTDPKQGLFSPGYPELNSDYPLQWLLDLWTPGPGYCTTRWGMVQTAAWLVPREVAERAGLWDPLITQDQDGEYFTRVLLASAGVRWEPEGRVYYRKFTKGASVSGGRSENHLRGRLRAVDAKARNVLPRTTDTNRSQAKAVLARQYMDIAYHAYPEHAELSREAEDRAEALGGYAMRFFEDTRLKHIERIAGWKAARRVSYRYRRLIDVRSHS